MSDEKRTTAQNTEPSIPTPAPERELGSESATASAGSLRFELLPKDWTSAHPRRAYEAADRLRAIGEQLERWYLAARREEDGSWNRASEMAARLQVERVDAVWRVLDPSIGWTLARRTPMQVLEALEREVQRLEGAPARFAWFAETFRSMFGREPQRSEPRRSVDHVRDDLIRHGHGDVARALTVSDVELAVQVWRQRGRPRRTTRLPRKWPFLAEMLNRAGIVVTPENLQDEWGKWKR